MAKKTKVEFCAFCRSDQPVDHVVLCPVCSGQYHKGANCACCGKVLDLTNVADEVEPEPEIPFVDNIAPLEKVAKSKDHNFIA